MENLTHQIAKKQLEDKLGLQIGVNEEYMGLKIRIELSTTRDTFSRFNLSERNYIVQVVVKGRIDNIHYKEVDKLSRGYFRYSSITKGKIESKIEKIKEGINFLIEQSIKRKIDNDEFIYNAKKTITKYLGTESFEMYDESKRGYVRVYYNGKSFKFYISDNEISKIIIDSSLTKEEVKMILLG